MAAKKHQQYDLAASLKELAENFQKLAYAPNLHSYLPHNKQVMFHSSQKRIRLYIGGNRSGKTTGGIVEDLWWLTKKHPYRTMPQRPVAGRIISVDFLNGIEKIIIPQLKQWVPPSELRGGSWFSAYDKGDRVLHFENGSFLELMSYDQDLNKFAGTSRDFVHFDEEPPEDIYTENRVRLIDRGGSLWVTMTPVEGMTWIFDTIYEKGRLGDDHSIEIVEVDMLENPYLNKTEVNEFLEGLSDDEREARGRGKFVQLGGLVYKTFDPKIHILEAIDPKKFRGRNYKQYMSLDHGYNNPTAVLWHAADLDNRVITFDEHYENEKTIDYHATVIKLRDKAHGRLPDIRICDPALAQRQAVTGTSIQTEYAVRGIGMVLGNNDVATGVAKVNQYLALRADGEPNWQITRNCANLIKEISRLRWKTWATRKQQGKNNPYDQIHKKDDHACDAARYFFAFMPELKQTLDLPVASVTLPEFSNNSVAPDVWRIDPNLTPEALSGANSTKWHTIDLNE